MMEQSLTFPAVDLAPLLRPISSEQPSGPDLEYSAELIALENAVREPDEPSVQNVVVVDQRDWAAIQKQARHLLAVAKDLRVANVLARALLHTEGLLGFCAAVVFYAELVERYWDDLYPRIGGQAGDPLERMNCLRELWNPALITQLRATELVSVRGLGAFRVQDVLVVKGLRSGSSETSPHHVLKALELAGPARLAALSTALRNAIVALRKLTDFVDSRVGDYGPLDPARLTALERDRSTPAHVSRSQRGLFDLLLIAIGDHAAQQRALRSVASSEPSDSSLRAGSQAAEEHASTLDEHLLPSDRPLKKCGEVHSRDDVLEALDQLCKYYERSEPSSPVPLLLQRAKRLATMNFVEIVRDLADKGLPQVEAVAGREATS